MSYRDAHMARQLQAAFDEQRNHDEVAHEQLAEIRRLLKCAEGQEVAEVLKLVSVRDNLNLAASLIKASIGGGR